ncbi:PREDICTED: olfactory receptor 5T2-like [Ceratotherium simum simum]|uniref:Olfactory receptor 5T2-like n=1 Tax=Ceratotherium simum simum TaxID=73337 RepID=A0ABM1DMZ2_CERSS|nr:PREDICTED: olfactory receptor 5T2-like [Ceratotherium simum simum]
MKNVTEVTIFVLKGFPDNFELQVILFFLFLAIYLFTLMGNLGLIVLVIGDSRLHNPMYYFLSVLSSVDACYSSVITPNMLVDFMSKSKVISFLGCATQIFLATTFGTTECFLLAAMAILKIHSAEGRRKVFSTCGSHLTGVLIYYGTIFSMYARPSSSYSLGHDMIVSTFYTIVIPMLNLIIYSLSNQDVKEAMNRVFGKNWFINKVYS